MRFITTLSLTITLLSLAGCGSQLNEKTSNVTSEIIETSFNTAGAPTVDFNVPAMHCESCAGAICETLKEVKGVVDVDTDVDSKTATVAIDQALFDSAAAIEALEEAEFNESSLVASAIETVEDPLIVVEEEASEDASASETE